MCTSLAIHCCPFFYFDRRSVIRVLICCSEEMSNLPGYLLQNAANNRPGPIYLRSLKNHDV